MQKTLVLDSKLVEAALNYTGETDISAVVDHALRELVAFEAGQRLAALGGSMPDLEDVPRRRPPENVIVECEPRAS